MNEIQSEEYLDELRDRYSARTDEDAAVVVKLLDEIDALDGALSDSEDEVERLRARYEPKAVTGSVSKLPSGKWRARWCDTDGKRHSRTFDRKHDARGWVLYAKSRGIGGAR
ncbi:hypothetical protein [Kitasatospora sp. NPDC087314]|uniref:hypothetical protein n=1 Tax=Kitasatospora sp. NPDC087314 TaxID=3364068 RepID=UPI003823B105